MASGDGHNALANHINLAPRRCIAVARAADAQLPEHISTAFEHCQIVTPAPVPLYHDYARAREREHDPTPTVTAARRARSDTDPASDS